MVSHRDRVRLIALGNRQIRYWISGGDVQRPAIRNKTFDAVWSRILRLVVHHVKGPDSIWIAAPENRQIRGIRRRWCWKVETIGQDSVARRPVGARNNRRIAVG